MSSSSLHEARYAQHLAVAGVTGWQREYAFAAHLGRRYRYDFAFRGEMVAVEIQGGTWHPGGRSHGHGWASHADAEKATLGAILGWRVLEFTGEHVRTGWALLATEVALGRRPIGDLVSMSRKLMLAGKVQFADPRRAERALAAAERKAAREGRDSSAVGR